MSDLIERIRHICVKGGVKETVMGEICLAVREELVSRGDVERQQWTPIKERLPEPQEMVLLYSARSGYGTGYWIKRPDVEDGTMWHFRDQCAHVNYHDFKLTHWAPLPNPPDNSPERT